MSQVTLTVAGRKVTITENTEPQSIWRGDNPDGTRRKVGEWPAKGWRFTVHGVLSGVALSRDGATARADYFARADRQHTARPRFNMSREAADALLDAEAADLAALIAAYPFDPEDVEKLTKIGFLDESGAVKRDRPAERAILMGVLLSTR